MATKGSRLVNKHSQPNRRYPWRVCALCEWHDDVNDCLNDPYISYAEPERRGCRFWECAGCGGPYDDVDDEGELVDHVHCMDGVIEIL